MPRVFVYGSLLPGEESHAVLAGARRLGDATTPASYTLYDLGPYPALVASGSTAIAGEVYEVGDALLAALDAFEGVPRLFVRSVIALADGTTAEAYLWPHAPRGTPIASGDYRLRFSSR